MQKVEAGCQEGANAAAGSTGVPNQSLQAVNGGNVAAGSTVVKQQSLQTLVPNLLEACEYIAELPTASMLSAYEGKPYSVCSPPNHGNQCGWAP